MFGDTDLWDDNLFHDLSGRSSGPTYQRFKYNGISLTIEPIIYNGSCEFFNHRSGSQSESAAPRGFANRISGVPGVFKKKKLRMIEFSLRIGKRLIIEIA